MSGSRASEHSQRPSLQTRRQSQVHFEDAPDNELADLSIQPLHYAQKHNNSSHQEIQSSASYFDADASMVTDTIFVNDGPRHRTSGDAQSSQGWPTQKLSDSGQYIPPRIMTSTHPRAASLHHQSSPLRATHVPSTAERQARFDTSAAKVIGCSDGSPYIDSKPEFSAQFGSPGRPDMQMMRAEESRRGSNVPLSTPYPYAVNTVVSRLFLDSGSPKPPASAHFRDNSASSPVHQSHAHNRSSVDSMMSVHYQAAPEYTRNEGRSGQQPPAYPNNFAFSAPKPALKRTQTEQETMQATRDAVQAVHQITQGLRRRGRGQDYRGDDVDTARATGVLSNLLQLCGSSTAASPGKAKDSECEDEKVDNGGVRPRLMRADTAQSAATSICEDDLDDHDPRMRAKYIDDDDEKLAPVGTKSRRYSVSAADADAISVRSVSSFKSPFKRSQSFVKDQNAIYGDLTGKNGGGRSGIGNEARLATAKNIAEILQRQRFIMKLAKALMTFGSPSHRLESQLIATAQVLQIDAQFVHLPTIVIASFGDPNTHTSETHFIKASGDLDLGRLHKVHNVYKEVVHEEVGVQEGSAALTRIMKAEPAYKLWHRMLFAAACCGIVSPMGFGGSFLDAWVAAAFGAILSFLKLYVVRKSPAYSNIFEISVATTTSFVARALSRTDYFCYPALSSAGVTMVLPGYAILCGSLELASKNIIAGSVRMVYAVIYSLFLGFGITVGSDFYYLFDPMARLNREKMAVVTTFTVDGIFNATNTTIPLGLTGTFAFTNATSSATDTHAALFKGRIMCARDSDWPWWRQGMNPYVLLALVPAFSLLLAMSNLQPLRSKQMPVMVIIACIGYGTNMLANHYIFNHSDIVSFIGSFVIGILGNLYSRLFRGTGFVVMVPGVLFLVPSGIAAAGGLAMSENQDGSSYTSGVLIGFRMIEVAIGITVGLFFSSFVVYSFGRRKRAALFAF